MIGETLANLPLWAALAVTLVGGAIGGVVYELLILHGNIEMPHRLTAAEQMENPHAIASYMRECFRNRSWFVDRQLAVFFLRRWGKSGWLEAENGAKG